MILNHIFCEIKNQLEELEENGCDMPLINDSKGFYKAR